VLFIIILYDTHDKTEVTGNDCVLPELNLHHNPWKIKPRWKYGSIWVEILHLIAARKAL